MPDHDATPDPMDKAYAQAETVLSDEAVRAARRARVLAAVAQEAAEAAPPAPRPAWRRGGWLVAAGVAGLSVLVAIQIRPPVSIEQPRAPAAPAAPAITADEGPNLPAPAVKALPAPAVKAPPAAAHPSRIIAAAPTAPAQAPEVASVEPSPPAPPPPPPPPPSPLQTARARPEAPPASAAPSLDSSISEVVVTGSRIEAPREARAVSGVRSPGPAARLRDAAARGRTAEVASLLRRGVPVDAADDDGDTALMESVRANHPEAAALLRRHGANLDLKNQAGESARDMAASIGDAELDRALGLER